MKNTFTLMAAAASLTPALATWGNEFCNSTPFHKPHNTPTKCNEEQRHGWGGFSGLKDGPFSNWGGFNFHGGWSCGGGNKRDEGLSARHWGGRSISASCGHDRDSAPKFGCGSDSGLTDFSIDTIDISVDFDCIMDFWYTMEDGSSCHQSHHCSKEGTTVKNTQCGGAKSISFVFPEQHEHPDKHSCGVHVHHVGYDCDEDHEEHSKTTVPSKPTSSKPPKKNTSTPPANDNTSPATKPTEVNTKPTEVNTKPTEVNTKPTEVNTKPTEVNTKPTGANTSGGPPVTNVQSSTVAAVTSGPASSDTTFVTTFDSTSTIFTTSVHTITSCGPEVTSCPAHSIKTITETVAVNTTVCPVTATMTKPHTKATSTVKGVETSSAPAQDTKPATTSAPAEDTKPATTKVTPTGTSTSPAGPDESMPCHPIVPKCLNTWLDVVEGCKDNTDASCYCPSEEFVDNVFECLCAHGEDADMISKAVTFFQGICAKWVPENPGIATGGVCPTAQATSTGAVKPTSTPAPTGEQTTITVDKTVTVPCVTEGTTMPGSSTVTTISTCVTVPVVTMPTDVTRTSVAVTVPMSTKPATATATHSASNGGSPGATGMSSFVTAKPSSSPAGTGGMMPTTTASLPPVMAGAAHVRAGMGVAVAAIAAAFAL